MKRLALKLFVLAGPFVLFFVAFQIQYDRQHPNAYAAKKFLLEQQKGCVEVLVLGPSYADDGILPDLLGQPAFNLAMPAQSLFYDRALLAKYVDQMPCLKVVLLPVSYVTLETQLDAQVEPRRCYDYRYEYGLSHRRWDMAWHPANFVAFCLDDRSPLAVLLGEAEESTSYYNEWGGIAIRGDLFANKEGPGCVTLLRESALSTLKWQRSRMKQAYLVENVQILHDMIQQLRRRDIIPILLSLPVHHFLAEGYDEAICRQEQAVLRLICSNTRIGYYDYTSDPRFGEADFHDASHLNYPGARKFSRIVRDEVLGKYKAQTRSASKRDRELSRFPGNS